VQQGFLSFWPVVLGLPWLVRIILANWTRCVYSMALVGTFCVGEMDVNRLAGEIRRFSMPILSLWTPNPMRKGQWQCFSSSFECFMSWHAFWEFSWLICCLLSRDVDFSVVVTAPSARTCGRLGGWLIPASTPWKIRR